MTTSQYGAAAAPPVGRLTVLHDPACLLCRHLTAWLRGQLQLVPLEFVAVASAEARERFPGLDHDASLGEITVVADTGEVWRGAHAFVACLWALAEHRPLAQRLSTPAGLPLARAAAFAASKYRQVTGAGRHVPGVEGAPGPFRPGGPAGGTNPFATREPYGNGGPYGSGGPGGQWPGPGCADGSCPAPG
ncbi:DCC1-like thiol-disulfide oxidoreductase family protein [Kitasatospora paracochleata]|uniref:DCC family thiol-disulfide oxidoreductase YuxK n=1 Tax=Kitasatospora paracochleata TaxID=58354 RepID=A0ABT1J5N9_9ACTN|nr:DCC1-like thiol-disulfide oxidoreductase family protein [Kitasatospora paracochleata]MCP2312756.1 putative DCC family thiol-disulfide oxidoreductase YuxK [Kitasatospora paracochleata]